MRNYENLVWHACCGCRKREERDLFGRLTALAVRKLLLRLLGFHFLTWLNFGALSKILNF